MHLNCKNDLGSSLPFAFRALTRPLDITKAIQPRAQQCQSHWVFNRSTYSQEKIQMKKRSERRKHCALAVVRRSQNFRPTTDPLPGGAGRPTFNQLEMVTIPSPTDPVWWRSDRCTQFRVIMVTDPQTNTPTNTRRPPQTGLITIHCAA